LERRSSPAAQLAKQRSARLVAGGAIGVVGAVPTIERGA
jgi:hypothetical protein